jgi:tetratricopeptide (TPR) repeat protein
MDETDSEADAPSAGEVSSSSESKTRAQKFQVTPEQRRFLGGAPSFRQQSVPEKKPARPAPGPTVHPTSPSSPDVQKTPRRARGWRISTPVELQKIVLLVGAVMLLGGAFYIGKKYEYWKYLIATRKDAEAVAKLTSEFAGASAEELVENAIVAERLGKWDEAARRFIAAKYKDAALGGVLFRAGKLYYDHSDFESADRLFESAIGYGENIDGANYYRGMIASARGDFPAAERFFEAAANAAPFNADYYYSLAETLRKDHHPKDAIARYEQAIRRGGGESEQTICRFKTRLAELEAGDLTKVSSEVEQQQSHGNLSADWIMTAAALEIQQGHIEQAIRLVEQARDADQSRLYALFAACVSDRFFAVASQNNPDLARACTVAGQKPTPAAAAEGSKNEPN